MTMLNELLAEFEAERLAEIAKHEARKNTPEQVAERAARIKRDIELGIRDEEGCLITDGQVEEEDDDEEEEGD
jgi:hypothetical protein